MPQYLPLPNGAFLEMKEGQTAQEAVRYALKNHPEAFGFSRPAPEENDGPDKSGFKAAASAAGSRLQGGLGLLAGKMGLMDSDKAEAYDKAKAAEANARFTPTKDSWIESPWQKLKETAGGSLPNMAATMGVGALGALAAPVVGLGAVAGTVGAAAAGAASTAAFTGSNLQRQMEDGKSLDEASGTKAFATAIPQALLDVIALRAIPGLGKIFGAAGKEITEESAKALVGQKVKELVKDYGWSTAKLMTKEGATEAAQAVLERAQAGLNITDADARNEYFENFMGGAALAGAIGPGGRYIERGQQVAKGKQLEQERLKKEQDAANADKLRQEAGAALEARQQAAVNEQATAQAGGAGPVRTPSLFGVEEDGNIRPPQEEAPEPPQSPIALAQQLRGIAALQAQTVEQKREAMAAAQTPQESLQIAEQFKAREAELEAAAADAKAQEAAQTKQAAEQQGAIKRLASLGKQWQQANDAGETETAVKLAAKMVTLEQKTGWTTAEAQLKEQEDAASRRELPKVGTLTRGGVNETAQERANRIGPESGMGPGADGAQRSLPGMLMRPPGPMPIAQQEERRAQPAAPEPSNDESAQGDMFVPYSGTQAPKTVTPMPDAAQQSLLDEPKISARLSGKQVARNPNAYDPLASKTKLAYYAQRNADPSTQLEASKERQNNAVEDELTDEQDRQLLRRKREEASREAWEDMRNPEASRPWDALPPRVQDLWMTAGERGVQRMELADRLAKLTNDAALPAEPKKTPEPEAKSPGRAPAPLDKMLGAATANKLEADDAALVERVRDKQALLEKDKNAVADINAWLYRTLMGGPNPEGAREVKGYLDTLDRAGTSETEQTRGRVAKRELTEEERAAIRGNTPGMLPGEEFRGNRHIGADGKPTMGRPIKETFENTTTKGSIDTAQQADMFPDPARQGEVFDSPEQLQDYLASDTAKLRREAAVQERQQVAEDPEVARQRVLEERRDAARREQQATLERQQSDGARRVEFQPAPNLLNQRNAKLEVVDENTDKLLAKVPDAVQEPRSPKEIARDKREQAKAAKAKRVDARTMQPSVTKKTKGDKPDVLPRNQYRGKITAYPAAGATNAVPETTTRRLTSEEISAQIKALGEQRAQVRANQQERIAASERNAADARAAADKKWAEVAKLEADSKARNKDARLEKMTAAAKKLEAKANAMVQARTATQRIVNDKREKALTAKITELNARQEVIQRAKDRAEGKPSPVLDEEVNKIAAGQQKWQPDEARAEQTEDEARAATLKRATGPVTRPNVYPPQEFRTGTGEGNKGGVDNRLKEARGTKQANTEIRKKEMAASNEDSKRFAEVKAAEEKSKEMTDEIRELLQLKLAAEKDAQTRADVEAMERMADEGGRIVEPWNDSDNNIARRISAYETAARNSTPLNEAAATAAAQGNLMSAVQDLAKNAKDGFVREAAAKLLPFLANTKVEVVNEVKVRGKVVDAKYDPKTNTITLSRALMSEETLLHEAVHAATIAAIDADPKTLTSEQRAALKDLQALFDRIKKDAEFSGEYGETDLKEFVSEVLSNKQLRDKLDNKVGYERSPLRAIWDAIAKFFGFDPKGSAAQTSEQIYKLFQPSEKLQTADTVASILRGVFPGRGARYSDTVSKEVQDITNASIGRQATLGDKLTAINSGLAWRTAIADRWAPIEALVKRGVAKGIIKEVQALQLRLHMRNHEQAGQYVSTAATQGVPQLRDQDGLLYGDPKSQAKNGKGTYAMASAPGANIKQIAEALTKANVGNEEATEMLFTQWMAVQRGKLVGFDKLNYTRELTPAQIKAIDDTVANDPATKAAFDEARKIYKQYNTDLMNLAVQAGLISKDTAAYYLKGDYVPFYRIEGNAVVMDLGTSKPITIGNVIDQPHLKELVGGNDKLLPFFDGAMQNTSMIIRTALRNMQTKDTTAMLRDLGYAVIHKEENGKTGPNGSIRFKHEGEQSWAELDKDVFAKDGIPAEVVLQGMQGIKTAVPGLVKLMSGPANFLRKTVTRMPLYALRQMIRDPLHAWLTTGGNFTPVLSSFKELAKVMKGESETDMMLKRAGVISSNVFTGDEQDTARILRDISTSKTPLNQALAKLDEFAMAADATTRAVLYDSFRKQGMGHHEALLNTLESMNFSRRGTSASLHWLGAMVPFFNAQIQGADAVYRSLKGDTSFEQKMDARNVLLKRGALIAASTMAYAMLMQDDEAYKNATPEERAMNWFLRVPGLDEPVRVPIPFELGLLFKSIPEAAINVAFGDTELKAGMKAIGKQLWMSTPLSLPTAINPAVELAANYSFFTDQPIESQRERGLTADQRYRPGTTEAAKLLGSLGVLSPVQVEHLVRGYTGGVGLTLMAAADLVLRPLTGADEVAKPERKNSELAVIGPLFQPNTGRGIINEAFNDIERFQQAHQSYKKLLESGERAEAAAFASKFSREIALASTGGAFRQQMGELATLKRNIAANREMSGEQKREQIERLKQVEITLAQRIKQLATAE